MRIAEIIGRVTLSRGHSALPSGRFVIVLPLPRSALVDGSTDRGEELVAFDPLGVREGDRIGLSEGGEAANPFGKIKTPIDAYIACLLDQINV